MNYTSDKLAELIGCRRETVERYLARPEFSHIERKIKWIKRKSVQYCGFWKIDIERLRQLCTAKRKRQPEGDKNGN